MAATSDEALEIAAKIVDRYADPLDISKRFPWLKCEIEFSHLMRFVSQEIRKAKGTL